MSSGGAAIYAIVETGGKQYKVSPGESLRVESLGVAEGDTVELDRVLAINNDGKLVVGKPVIEGAKVTATSRGDGLGDKIIGMKYKHKVRYSRKIGHRQAYTELSIDSISGPGIQAEKPAKAKAEKVVEETTAVAEVEKPVSRTRRTPKAEAPAPAAEKPAPRPRRSTKKEEK